MSVTKGLSPVNPSRPGEFFQSNPARSSLPNAIPLLFQPFRHFPFMARGVFIGSWVDLYVAGRQKFQAIFLSETTRLVARFMLFVSLFRSSARHTHVVAVLARLVFGVVVLEFTVRQYRRIQLDDVNHEALRVVGRHSALKRQIKNWIIQRLFGPVFGLAALSWHKKELIHAVMTLKPDAYTPETLSKSHTIGTK